MAMKMKRRQFLTAFAATAGSAVLAACAPKAEPTAAPAPAEAAPKAEAPKDEAPQPAAQEKITLRFHMRAGGEQSEPPFYVTRPQEYMEANPGITIELAPLPGGEYMAKIQTMAAAKTLGDIIFLNNHTTDHGRCVRLGIVASSDDQMDAMGISKDEWLPAAMEALTYDGKLYGLPKASHPGYAFIAVNEDLFEAAGLPIPEQYGNTPEAITEWAEKLTTGPKGDRGVYGYWPGTDNFYAYWTPLRRFGTFALNEEGTECLADNDQWWDWVQWTYHFFDGNLAPVADALPTGGVNTLFAAGKLAMRHGERNIFKGITSAVEVAEKPVKWRAIQIPARPEPEGFPACVGTHVATTQTKHRDEAFKFEYALADARTSELSARDIGYLGGRVDSLEVAKAYVEQNPFLELQYNCSLDEKAYHHPNNLHGAEVQSVQQNELDKLWLGQEPLTRDFMLRFKAAIEDVLAKPF